MTQGYVADIEFMDAHLRRLMAGLRELGWYDAALIAFTSDHGEEIYEHGAWGHGDSLYDEVLRVPLILKLPRAAAAGSEVPALTRQVDLAPTLLELAGIPVPSSMVGVPILARDGSPGATGPGLCLSSLRSRGNDMDAIRSRDVSLIRALETRQERIAPLELYDLRQDPGQQRNLAGRDDPRQRPLESALERLVERSERRGLESLEMDPASTVDSRLRALGYLK